jgi:hypothetical protein
MIPRFGRGHRQHLSAAEWWPGRVEWSSRREHLPHPPTPLNFSGLAAPQLGQTPGSAMAPQHVLSGLPPLGSALLQVPFGRSLARCQPSLAVHSHQSLLPSCQAACNLMHRADCCLGNRGMLLPLHRFSTFQIAFGFCLASESAGPADAWPRCPARAEDVAIAPDHTGPERECNVLTPTSATPRELHVINTP